ncbi:MAG: PIG-L family deacetylase [Propioniciclava sp.]
MDVSSVLTSAQRVLVVHAHPDDETLATGGLIAALARQGVSVQVLTATRGEQGEIVPGALTAAQETDLIGHRERELARACALLGVSGWAFLGTPPARAKQKHPRRYTDSGMRWLDAAETMAGPGSTAGEEALSHAAPAEVAADIAAYAGSIAADLIITYDRDGGYGHPDHVALHRPARQAATELGVGFLEVASAPDSSGIALGGEEYRAVITAALRSYASQLTVAGTEVVHVGGQRQPIAVSCTLRVPAT